MRKVPEKLQSAFVRKIEADPSGILAREEYCKWLRFYLDFCDRHECPPREPGSLAPFLKKLKTKGQSSLQLSQAAASIGHFYGLMETWKD